LVTLTTERLILREFKPDDWPAVFAYASDPEVVRFMRWGPSSPEEVQSFLAQVVEWQQAAPRTNYCLAAVLTDSQRLIGGVGIHIVPSDEAQSYVGYCFHRDEWGKSLATESCRALLRFGFQELNLHRIIASCDSQNIASARVLEKSGMHREAHFRQDLQIKGRWRDTLLFAALADGWMPSEQAL
jgi:[ribosomal protein S5]-alanine N-acetyltransferase